MTKLPHKFTHYLAFLMDIMMKQLGLFCSDKMSLLYGGESRQNACQDYGWDFNTLQLQQ